MSYDEHLISMAGGDGDVLGQIQARDVGSGPALCDEPCSAECVAVKDRRALLAMVRERDAKLERVKALCSDWDAVVDVFPLTPAALFAGSHANRVREALEPTA